MIASLIFWVDCGLWLLWDLGSSVGFGLFAAFRMLQFRMVVGLIDVVLHFEFEAVGVWFGWCCCGLGDCFGWVCDCSCCFCVLRVLPVVGCLVLPGMMLLIWWCGFV